MLVCFVAIGVIGSGALGASRAPLADAAQRVGGSQLRDALTFTALLTTASTANAVLIVTSRISFAMARDGLLPRRIAAVSHRSAAPWASLVLSAGLLEAVAAPRSIALAAAIGGFLYVLHFVVPLCALVKLRRRGELALHGGLRAPAPRITLPLPFLACGALLIASGWTGAAGGVAWLGTGVLGYSATRRHGRHRAHV